MRKDFSKYCNKVGLKGAFKKRAEETINFYENLYPDQLKSIFITEVIDTEGNRHYQNLWLFTDKHALEAKDFLTRDDFDSAIYQNCVGHWTIIKEEYDFKSATPKSRMTLHFLFTTGISGTLQSSGENCNYLRDILINCIIPNYLKEPSRIVSRDNSAE